MNIWKRANSPYYSYRFAYKGKIYSRSTGTTNKVDAMNVASAARVKLIRQEAGLEEPEPAAKSGQGKSGQGESGRPSCAVAPEGPLLYFLKKASQRAEVVKLADTPS